MTELAAAPPQRATWRERWKRRVIVYGSLYLIAMISSFGCHLADRLILFPTDRPIHVAAERKSIDLQTGTLEIIAARSRAAKDIEPQAFILEFTGNASRAEMVAEDTAWQWQKHPVEVWAVNYPGYGSSSGPARLQAIADTSLIAFDRLKALAADRPIFIVGTSLGTTAALHVAANREVAGLILTNPPPLRQLIRGKFGWWNLWLVALPVSFGVPADLDSLANAARCRAPAMFVLSARDEIVPLAYQQRVAAAYAGPKRLLSREGANHNDAIEGSDQAWMTEQIEWLWQTAALDSPPTAH
jgi:pimeloyl-ACP methyl ester carboxylesterase